MGGASSKLEKDEARRLCKSRKRFIKQAIDSRYALAAAHVVYIQSLRNVGISLRRYAEAEVLIESSLSMSATDLDKTPSHSSYPSPSPSRNAEVISDSPHNESPISPPVAALNYMRSGGGAAVTVMLNPTTGGGYADDESFVFQMPPPPPPPELSSWDYFDTSDDVESFKHAERTGLDDTFHDVRGWRQSRSEGIYLHGKDGLDEKNESREESLKLNSENLRNNFNGQATVAGGHPEISDVVQSAQWSSDRGVKAVDHAPASSPLEKSASKRVKSAEDLSAEKEDPSEFITHRAKDFLSSIKDIEHRFFRANEAGKEVSRLLEANKIRVGYSEAKGSSPSVFATAFQLVCCRRTSALVSNEPQHVTKVITWNRSTSSRSSSSKNPLTVASKEDNYDSGSDYVEEFCMFAGSHSSTLDRLYAWERKLYDEVKGSESIRKEYDQKCHQLRHQSAKDLSSQVIDKTRAAIKDLHSRIRVALHSVDSISKRIEKMRDEELQPQLMELIQGLTRMWKAMLECHHAQYITISLAYHARSNTGTPQGDSRRHILAQLRDEIDCFGLSFRDWINSLTSYVEALNGWLQNCIMLPRERAKSRRPFSPRRVLAPPIFVLFRDWSSGIQALPSNELSDAIKNFLADINCLGQSAEEVPKKAKPLDSSNNEGPENKDDDKCPVGVSFNLNHIQASLTKVLDWLTKFSEASLKMYEDIRQKNERASNAYSNCNVVRF